MRVSISGDLRTGDWEMVQNQLVAGSMSWCRQTFSTLL